MPNPSLSKPGNAPIKQVGHTAGAKYGQDPYKQPKGSTASRDLRVGRR